MRIVTGPSTSASKEDIMRKLIPPLLVGLSLLTLEAGCGSSAKTTAHHEPTAPTPARSSAANLNGSYVRTITKSDIARTNSFRHEGPGQVLIPRGVYHLTFSGGTFRATDPTGFGVAQTYSATGKGHLSVILYVNPNQGSFCGPDIPQSAAYKWSLSNDILTLTANDDGCADRDSILQGHWTRVGT
jgi:hypothetical protein